MAASCAGISAQAQEASLPDGIERITTTGTRTGVNPDDVPMVISAVNADNLALIAPTHIEEALKLVAGAGVQRGNGQEYLPSLRSEVFSGAGACGGILTAEDGIPLRAAGFCNINELFEAHSEMAQRIEVLKGPGSALYGSNAVHGVINVITPDTTRGGGMAGIDYGSYGYSRYKVRSGKDFGNSGIGINASVTRDTGYRDEESVDQEKVNIRHRYEWDNVTLTSGFTYTNLDQKTAGYITGFESYKDEALAQTNENPDAFRKAQSLRVWSQADWQLGNGDVITITPYVRDQDMEFFMHFLPGTPMEENSQTGAGVQTLWQHQLANKLTLRTGLDAEYTEGALLQYQEGATEGSDFLVETVPEGKHYDYDVDATLYAPFVSLEWEQDAWLVTAGLRYEHMEYDYTNNMLTGRTRDDGTECGMGGCRYSRPPSGNDSYSNASPKLGLVYRYSPQMHFYANLSRGYRAPQATELYRLQRDQQVADLKSETANNAEVGIKGALDNLRYVVSAYLMQKDNYIFRDSNYFNVNDGESKHRGIEVELDWQFSPSWDIAVAATYAKHTYDYDQVLSDININGNDIDTSPNLISNIRLGWDMSDATRVELEWNHVSQYYTDPENLHEYEGHDLLNLRASWAITPALTAFARVNNLTDEAYAERADFTEFGGDRYFPGRPRNVMVSLNYRW
ncbi:TonB-dependent receptor [Alteromonas pelagimontana]|uniref:TonB-dependent receptor n=1 Tax=Alteromonas pelagimontana TaxID=1858656 RepID=A0A6M4MIA9_9ALTE|nr:TonB-dependent receptor [Alteromonas pelagimontana]QJR82777.1 TonB-dependent receptor [Alteromonas pelagimontana]